MTRNHRTLKPIFFLLLLTGALAVRAQSAHKLARDYMEKYNKYVIDPGLSEQLMDLPGDMVIEAFEPYLSDTLARTRDGAYRMVQIAGLAAEDPAVRGQAVKILVTGLNDADGGIAGRVIGYMQEFEPADFDREQRYYIAQKVKGQPVPGHLGKLVLLTGYLKIEELVYDYKHMLADSGLYKPKDMWDMKLAMARVGDKESEMEATRRIGRLELNDDLAYDIYPNLAYIRTKDAFDILLDGIMSEGKSCISSNPDNEVPITCAFRIMEYTARYIKSFPVETDAFGVPVIDDYDAALAKVREWIKTNREDYELVEDKY